MTGMSMSSSSGSSAMSMQGMESGSQTNATARL